MARTLSYNCVLMRQKYINETEGSICLKVTDLSGEEKILDFLSSTSIDDLVRTFIRKGWSLNEADKVTTIEAPYIWPSLGLMWVPAKEEELKEFYIEYNKRKTLVESQQKVRNLG